MIRSFLGILLIIPVCLASAQETGFKRTENLRQNNRWEGYDQQNISSKFRLIAWHGSRLKRFDAGDILKVRFYVEAEGNARIQGRKIRQGRTKYRMEVKNETWNNGWQTFEPWSVDAFLVPEKITANNLGILIRHEKNHYLPGLIFKDEIPEEIRSYKVYFHTPAYIRELSYELTEESSGDVVDRGSTEDEDAQSAFYLKLTIPEKYKAGMYTLTIVYTDSRKHQESYRFYHHPNPQ